MQLFSLKEYPLDALNSGRNIHHSSFQHLDAANLRLPGNAAFLFSLQCFYSFLRLLTVVVDVGAI